MVQPTPLRPDPSTQGEPPSAPPANGQKTKGNVVSGAFPKAPPRLTAEEREFLPAAMEVIETPASPTLRLTAWGICGLVLIAIGWASLSHIDMVAVADGKVVPLGQVKVVQPLETAMIRAIHVDEGDHVSAGQLIVDLDPTEARADLDALLYNRTQAALDVEVTRILLTGDPSEPFRPPEGADPVLAEQGRTQAQREIEKHLAAVAGYAADIEQKAAALRVNEAQIERARLTIPLIAEKHETAKGLYDKRIGARPPVLDTQQQLRAAIEAIEGLYTLENDLPPLPFGSHSLDMALIMGELRRAGWILVASRQPPLINLPIDPALDERICAAFIGHLEAAVKVARAGGSGDRTEMRY